MFPGGNIFFLSCFFCSCFRRETFALETQPWKGWSVNLLHVQSTLLLPLLLSLHLPLPLRLHLRLRLRLLLRLLFRDATRHFMQGVSPCMNGTSVCRDTTGWVRFTPRISRRGSRSPDAELRGNLGLCRAKLLEFGILAKGVLQSLVHHLIWKALDKGCILVNLKCG